MAFTEYQTQNGDPVWEHEQTGEQVVGGGIWQVENREQWHMVWECPACGKAKQEIPDGELIDAGFCELHLPCADEDQEQTAIQLEGDVQQNYRAAKSAGF